jgi:hypothetical protein
VKLVLALTMLACAGIAGFVGWRRATKPIYRRSMWGLDVPDGLTRRDYERLIRTRRKRWRLAVTALYALMGAGAGVVLLMLLNRT